MQYNSFVFDFDGVLVDTEAIWFDCLLDFVERHRLKIPRETMEDYIGDGDTKMMALLSDALGSRAILDELYYELRDDFRARTEHLKPRAGVLDYFDYADRHHIKIVCASNSNRAYIDHWLKKLGLEHRFYAILTKENVGEGRIKPCPDLYLEAVSILKVRPTECVAFEDTPIGLQAAEKAGLLAIAVPNRATQSKLNRLPNYQLNMAQKTPEQFLSDIASL